MKDYLSTAADAATQPIAESAAVDEELASEFPALHVYLTAPVDSTGKPRRTSTLVIFTESGQFKGTLIERQYDMQLWATGDTMKQVLEALDADLRNPRPLWRKPTKARR